MSKDNIQRRHGSKCQLLNHIGYVVGIIGIIGDFVGPKISFNAAHNFIGFNLLAEKGFLGWVRVLRQQNPHGIVGS